MGSPARGARAAAQRLPRAAALALLVSIGVFFAWMRWLRPRRGAVGGRAAAARPDAGGGPRPARRRPPLPRARAASGAKPRRRRRASTWRPCCARRPADDRAVDPAAIDAILRVRGRAPRLDPPGPPGHPGPLPLSPGRRAAAGVRGERDHARAGRRRGVVLRAVPAHAGRRAHHPRVRRHGVPRRRRRRSAHRAPALPGHGGRLRHGPDRHVHRRTRGLHRVVQPRAGHHHRRPDLRAPDGALGVGRAPAVHRPGGRRGRERAPPTRTRRRPPLPPASAGIAGRRRSRFASASGTCGRGGRRRRGARRACTKRWPPSAAAPRSRRSAAAGSATTSRWSRCVAGGRRVLYGNVEARRRAGARAAPRAAARACCARSAKRRTTCGRGSSTIAPGSRSRRAPSTRRPTSASRCASSSRTAARSIRCRWTSTASATACARSRRASTRLTPDEVIDHVRRSGLRGRGGAGFPTAVKWDLTRRAAGSPKYVICNGDEGDPGAFMDRAVLESDPFRVIEGLAIAAYAVGASEGIVYVRSEYPIAVRHARAAIAAAEAHGLLGDRILGSAFSFTVQVREGAGAFVCGEETALIQSIEGERGMPRLRPPYPAESGLWGKPTLINNVETLACLPWIFRRGPEAFAALGHRDVEGHEGVLADGQGEAQRPHRSADGDHDPRDRRGHRRRRARAAGASRPSSPAGRRAAASRRTWPTRPSTSRRWPPRAPSWDRAASSCSTTATARSRSPATSCTSRRTSRAGSARTAASARSGCSRSSSASATGAGWRATSQTLDELSQRVKTGSLCGLGQTAPNPVLTTLRYFRDEYEAHIRERRCPAAVVQGAHPLPGARQLHRVHAVRAGLPGRRHRGPAVRPARGRRRPVHALRHVRDGVPRERHRGRMMARPITLTIDGQATSVEAGTTILEAARALGIRIPTLVPRRRLPAVRVVLPVLRADRGQGHALAVVRHAGRRRHGRPHRHATRSGRRARWRWNCCSRTTRATASARA